jgi:hypothetical protein
LQDLEVGFCPKNPAAQSVDHELARRIGPCLCIGHPVPPSLFRLIERPIVRSAGRFTVWRIYPVRGAMAISSLQMRVNMRDYRAAGPSAEIAGCRA